MNNNKQGRDPIYPESFKIAVAREYLTGNLGFGKLAKKHNLAGAHVTHYFVRWYKKRYPDSSGVADSQATTMVIKPVNDRELEKQLKQANLKIAGLEMLIEIAQKELGIDIVKKPGTKQSPK
jgi:transposase-like protein